MIVVLLAFLGGALTIVSPCILPVVPFVLARTGQPFVRSTLPLLIGMAATFALISTLAAVGGAWAVHLDNYGRIVAMVLLAVSGVALLSRTVADRLTRPLVALGSRLSQQGSAQAGVLASLLLGVATGFLWAPCAGPILALILTGAAINGPSTATTLLLLAYAVGAATSLAIVALASARVIAALKGSFAAGEWLRRTLGACVLVAVVAIALHWDTTLLTRLSLTRTQNIEEALIAGVAPHAADPAASRQGTATAAQAAAGVEGGLPSLEGADAWINSPPLTPQMLRGKVVLIDFWTYSCINCLRTLPYVKAWYARYHDRGLVVIGVHTPEFAFEKDIQNVTRAVHDLGITYPVALDNDYAIWTAFDNQYWPAHYFIDAQSRIRGHHFGEGGYAESEELLRTLLTEAGGAPLPPAVNATHGTGVEAAPDEADIASPETYLGYQRAQNFASAGGAVHDAPHTYQAPRELQLNQWALSGIWRVEGERAVSAGTPASIVFRFRARDLNLVLGPGASGHAVRFRVTLDGHTPGGAHGADVAPDGTGSVGEQRLYQLLRQDGPVAEHTFAIEFLDPGVEAYSFTFG